MFGSGAKTIGIVAMLERRMMARRGLIMIIVLSLENVCAAVLGAATLFAVVLPSASGSTPSSTTATSVFGLRVSPQDFNPLLFCLFALCLPPLGGSIFFLRFSRVRSGQLLPFWEQFNLNCDG